MIVSERLRDRRRRADRSEMADPCEADAAASFLAQPDDGHGKGYAHGCRRIRAALPHIIAHAPANKLQSRARSNIDVFWRNWRRRKMTPSRIDGGGHGAQMKAAEEAFRSGTVGARVW